MFLKNIFKKKKKILGRGESSGRGKTSGRGCKGQKSRSGKKYSKDFEGGQTPFFKRLPKFGTRRKLKKYFSLTLFSLIKIPFTLISLKILKNYNIFKKKFSAIKLFSFSFSFKKFIFYKISFSNLILFFFLNFNYFFIF